MKRITILGSTGSIGTQTLDVIRANRDLYEVVVLTAHNNINLLIKQAVEFKPSLVVIGNIEDVAFVQQALPNVVVLAGTENLIVAAQHTAADVVVTAVMGAAGLKPTVAAIEAGKHIALANKETLVVAGSLIMDLAKKHGVDIIPVDSEHSAIFQCMVGEDYSQIEKIYLTASGGPFLGKDASYLATINKTHALKHPNWVMGAKITIDSASLMNKGLEVIEAKWLFNLEPEQIEVIVHPQSIIHSLVQFKDGSIKAQLGLPDMKLPIHYALAYPTRINTNFERFNFLKYPQFTFLPPDKETFVNLGIAYKALEKGGNMPCIINAANEIVVASFLKDEIGFLEMSSIIKQCMDKLNFIENPTLDDFLETDQLTRSFAANLVTIAAEKSHTIN